MECPNCFNKEMKRVELNRPLTALSCTKCNGKWVRSDDFSNWVNYFIESEDEESNENDIYFGIGMNNVFKQYANAVKWAQNKGKVATLDRVYDEIEQKSDYKKYGIDIRKETADLISELEREFTSKESKISEPKIKISDSKNAKICADCGRIMIKYKVGRGLDFVVENCGYCGGVWLDNNKWETLESNKLHFKLYEIFTEPWQKKSRDDEKKEFFEKKYNDKFGREDYRKVKELKKWLDSKDNRDDLINYILKMED